MKYDGLPWGMWVLYRRSFRNHLVSDLGLTSSEAKRVTAAARSNYKKVIAKLPEFEKADQFDVNIVNCALLIAFLQAMSTRPDVVSLTEFYANAMMNPPTRWFCRIMGKQKFTDKDIRETKETATLKAADRNPYSWNMDYLPYADGSGYEDRFYACGICTLMKEYGFYAKEGRKYHWYSESKTVAALMRRYQALIGEAQG
ncbi:L-2-amino-thiazoline-4-carboxylic acid hydrolase [Pseudoramibacter sp. HA2172]|uniref:L-2-amino-thiazoline-4-carboxylic acid hydrolase n=1 Tax=Pseudoramibacter faecis TaxID=3108534 RepID=UPI002E77047C|nr:L-2-amino-thiazoline-4-carboxylic acid hydrolase [Pseudoramibacter sp. HA2172]